MDLPYGGALINDTISVSPDEFESGSAWNAFWGWYFGYTECCVKAFDQGRYSSPKQLHPVSGHVLCEECARTGLADLRERIAARYAIVWESRRGGIVRGEAHDFHADDVPADLIYRAS